MQFELQGFLTLSPEATISFRVMLAKLNHGSIAPETRALMRLYPHQWQVSHPINTIKSALAVLNPDFDTS